MAVGVHWRQAVRGVVVGQGDDLQFARLGVLMLCAHGFVGAAIGKAKLPSLRVKVIAPSSLPLALCPAWRCMTSSLPSATLAVQSYCLARRVMKLKSDSLS